jgi:hypothetical protein
MMQCILKPGRNFEFWKDDEEFYRDGAKVPRANAILDVSKLLSIGIRMTPVQSALQESLERWQSATRLLRNHRVQPDRLPVAS